MGEVSKMPDKKLGTLGRMRAMTQTITSQLVSRMQLSNWAGLSFGGKRDLYKIFGYDRALNYNKYIARYQRSGLAQRIVNAYPEATWRNPPVISDSDDDLRDSDFEKAWDDLVRRFKVFSLFERVDKLTGLGEYAVLFIGAPGEPKQPLKKLKSIDDLLFITPYGQGGAIIQTVETDPTNAHFGYPNIYRIGGVDLTHLNVSMPVPASAIMTHYSRIFHIAEGLLEGSLFGKPRLEGVWNYLDDLDKIVGGSAEMFWLAGNRGLQVDVNPDYLVDDLTDLDDEVEEYIHGINRIMRTQGVNVKELGTTTADPSGTFDVTIKCISGATGIPQRILLGSEAGQLASTQDHDNWNERVIERREAFADPFILRPFIDKMIELGILPEPQGGNYQAEWPDLMAYSADQKSVQAFRESTALSNYANAKSKGVTVLTDGEIRKRWFGLGSQIPDSPNDDQMVDQHFQLKLDKMKKVADGMVPAQRVSPNDPNANIDPTNAPGDRTVDQQDPIAMNSKS